MYVCVEITKLGRRLQLRQQAQATAQIYVRRFYTKVEIRRTNPYLVLAVALYLAAKMEECPQHIRLVVNEARNAWPGEFFFLFFILFFIFYFFWGGGVHVFWPVYEGVWGGSWWWGV